MSVIGTGTAAAVAQTVLQAQQVARRRDKERTENANDVRRLRDLLEAHLEAVEEGDESNTPVQLHVDEKLPEHQGPVVESARKQYTGQDGDNGNSSENPLYRHLDVQA